MKDNSKKNKYSSTTTASITALLSLVGGFFLLYNFIESKKILAYDYMAHQFYTNREVVELEVREVLETEDFYRPNQDSNEVSDEYIGYLTIPKINLTKGFLDSRSKLNDVDKNIMVIEGSNYPDVDKGNFMIAGHSGSGWKSFFSELHKLEIGDEIYIDYKGKKYTYNVQKIYTQPKVGTLAVYRDYNQTPLTLITCTNNDSKTQPIIISQLTNIE